MKLENIILQRNLYNSNFYHSNLSLNTPIQDFDFFKKRHSFLVSNILNNQSDFLKFL